METCQTIEIQRNHDVATLWFNRPEVHNAFNALMIQELIQILEYFSSERLRVLIIRGKGKSFCAGADLNWMKECISLEYEESLKDSLQLARCLQLLYHFPSPVIVMAHGHIYGGGIGFLAVADVSICSKDTSFCFSEVSIGLIPAIISPYVIRRIGEFKAKEYMLTGNLFSGEDAANLGLVNWAEESYNIDTKLDEFVQKFKYNSRTAMLETKKLINNTSLLHDEGEIIDYTTNAITQARISHDGQEGMSAFFEKRKPRWK